MEDNPTQGGSGAPSQDDLGRMIRETVQSWQPRRGPDWPDILMRLSKGPSPWLLYTAASAALVVILLTAFLVGSWLQIGALAPQPVQVQIH